MGSEKVRNIYLLHKHMDVFLRIFSFLYPNFAIKIVIPAGN